MKNTSKVSNRYIRHMYRLAREIIEFYADGQNWEEHLVETGVESPEGIRERMPVAPKVDGGLRARAFLKMETLATVKLKYQGNEPYDASGKLPSVTKALSNVAAREARKGLPTLPPAQLTSISQGNVLPVDMETFKEHINKMDENWSRVAEGNLKFHAERAGQPTESIHVEPFDASTVKPVTEADVNLARATRMTAEAAARPHGHAPILHAGKPHDGRTMKQCADDARAEQDALMDKVDALRAKDELNTILTFDQMTPEQKQAYLKHIDTDEKLGSGLV